MRRYSQRDVEPMKSLAKNKAKGIKELKGNCKVYFESNHCFIKGFGWFIPQYLPEDRIGVIILKREKSKIAESLLRIGCSPLVPFGREWINTPDMKDPLVTPPKILISPRATYQGARLARFPFRATRFLARKVLKQQLPYPQWLINYELECLQWYVEETYARAEVFKQQFPSIKYYEVNVEHLNSLESVEQMLSFFGCSGKNSLSEVVGKKFNLKRSNNAPAKPGALNS